MTHVIDKNLIKFIELETERLREKLKALEIDGKYPNRQPDSFIYDLTLARITELERCRNIHLRLSCCEWEVK
jgi:hypothetical protein